MAGHSIRLSRHPRAGAGVPSSNSIRKNGAREQALQCGKKTKTGAGPQSLRTGGKCKLAVSAEALRTLRAPNPLGAHESVLEGPSEPSRRAFIRRPLPPDLRPLVCAERPGRAAGPVPVRLAAVRFGPKSRERRNFRAARSLLSRIGDAMRLRDPDLPVTPKALGSCSNWDGLPRSVSQASPE